VGEKESLEPKGRRMSFNHPFSHKLNSLMKILIPRS